MRSSFHSYISATIYRVSAITLCFTSALLFNGCGGTSSTSNTRPNPPPSGTTPPTVGIQLNGAAVKGPLANAVVRAHVFDQDAVNRVGSQIGQDASTGPNAAITGLVIPEGTATPFIIEITAAENTVDLSLPAGVAPAIKVLTEFLKFLQKSLL